MTELSITEARALMDSGEASAASLVANYLQRIEQFDRAGPALNSVIEVNLDAAEIAAGLDAERARSGPRGPLHGVPVLLKDNIDTGDKMMTTAGSLALAGPPRAKDAPLVALLREAGAVILGKTNLSEWANFRSTRSTSGWSSRGGQTKHPYALDRNPSGSSSGSGTAAAADLCLAAIGTETDGSIISPSSRCGIVGLKPTVGLVSGTGIVPIGHSQDTAGPMTRSVMDAALVLEAMSDPAKRAASYTAGLDVSGLKGARIGVARSFWGADVKVDAVMEEALAALRNLGAELIDPIDLAGPPALREAETETMSFEFKNDINAYLGALGPEALVHNLEELIEFNEKNRDRVMPYFGQEGFLRARDRGPLTSEAYLAARHTCLALSREKGIDAALSRHKLDAIIAPSNSPAGLIDLVNGDHRTGAGSSQLAAVSGYPNITVPAGYIAGLPIGISFFAGAYQEATLLKLAFAFEQGTKARRAPKFLPTAEL